MLFGGLWEGAQGLFRLARVTGGGGGGGGGSGGGGVVADLDALQLSSGGC